MRGARKFCQRGSKFDNVFFFFFFFFELMRGYRIQIPRVYKRAIIRPPAKHHLNGVLLAGRGWPNIECWLGSFVIFQWMGTLYTFL